MQKAHDEEAKNEKDDIVCKTACGNYDGIFLNGGGVLVVQTARTKTTPPKQSITR